MASFDPYTWYVLRNAAQSVNNTLTASNNTQTAFDPNSPSAIYYAPGNGTIPSYQQWQLFPVNSSSSSAFVLRNRLIGPDAYLTTAWTTRKCGGGACATVPVLSSSLNNESLWNFASWGWSDVTGGAYVYNLGNGTDWRLDVMDGGVSPELVNFDDTGRLAQHWTVSAYASFVASESSSFKQVPTTATALVAQFAGQEATGSVTPYTIATSTASVSSGQAGTSATGSAQSSSTSHSGLSTSAAIGIGVGIGVAVLVIIVGLAIGFFCYRKRKTRRSETSPASTTPIISDRTGNKTTREVEAFEVEADDKKYHEMASPIEVTGPIYKAEMSHPSERIRHELHSGYNSGMSPVELEHASAARIS